MSSLVAKCCVGNNYSKTKSLGNAVNTDLKYSASKHWQSLLSQPVLLVGLVEGKNLILQSALVSLQRTNSILMLCKGTSGGVSFSGQTWWCPTVLHSLPFTVGMQEPRMSFSLSTCEILHMRGEMLFF